MRTELLSSMPRLVRSLKVAALVSVLGAVVLAAEHRLEAAPEQALARPTMAGADSRTDRSREQVAADYFPLHLPAPSDQVAAQPATN